MTWRRRATSAAATEEAGRRFASLLCPGDVVLVSGQLGVGKTTFARGVGRGLGVVDAVTSPTFVLVREHECRNDAGVRRFHHADVYRVASLDEVADLALGELVEESGVALVEWGEIATSLFGRDVLRVDMSLDGDDARTIEVTGELARGRELALDDWTAP